MNTLRSFSLFLLSVLVLPAPRAAGQSVVVDDGTFRIRIDDREAGSEEFTIRRAGLGADATMIAHGVVRIDVGEGRRELRPMLQALPPAGVATGYQLKISGAETTQLNMTLAGGRYISVLRSQRGEEEREFLARDETRIIDAWVAHHYYFLRNAREGDQFSIIEPRTRRQYRLETGASVDEAVTVAGSRVAARRVAFRVGGEERRVWFDDQGRVLRLEIPSLDYVASRQDLAG